LVLQSLPLHLFATLAAPKKVNMAMKKLQRVSPGGVDGGTERRNMWATIA